MPKVRGPLFSVEARKSLGKVLTYQRRPGGASVYGYTKPKVPLTYLQVQQRGLIAAATAYWQSLGDAAKAEWEAKAAGQGQSGYSYMIRQYVKLNFDRPLWLPFNEGTGVTTADRSGHGNNGSIEGASWEPGLFGYALSFDNEDDYIDCGNSDALRPVSAVAVEAWIRPSTILGANNIVSSQAGTASGFYLSQSAAKLQFWYIGLSSEITTDTDVFLADEWYHVVGQYNSQPSNSVDLFVNGVFVKTGTPTGTPTPATLNLFIGRYAASNVENFGGLIEKVSIFNRALSVVKVRRDFNRERALYGV